MNTEELALLEEINEIRRLSGMGATSSRGLQLLYECAHSGDPNAEILLEGIMDILTDAGKQLVAKAKKNMKGAALSVALLLSALNPTPGQAEEYYQALARATFSEATRIEAMDNQSYQNYQFELEIATAENPQSELSSLIGKSKQEIVSMYKQSARTVLQTKPEAPAEYKQQQAASEAWTDLDKKLKERKAPRLVRAMWQQFQSQFDTPWEVMNHITDSINKINFQTGMSRGLAAGAMIAQLGQGGLGGDLSRAASFSSANSSNAAEVSQAGDWLSIHWNEQRGRWNSAEDVQQEKQRRQDQVGSGMGHGSEWHVQQMKKQDSSGSDEMKGFRQFGGEMPKNDDRQREMEKPDSDSTLGSGQSHGSEWHKEQIRRWANK